MMTINFSEREITTSLLEVLKDNPLVYDINNMDYLNNALNVLRHYSSDSNEFDKEFNNALFHKSEGLFYELFGLIVEAYNGSDVVIVFDRQIDIPIVETIIHNFLFYFGVQCNLVFLREDLDNLKSINETDLFDVSNIIKYMDTFLMLHEKVCRGEQLTSYEINHARSAFIW